MERPGRSVEIKIGLFGVIDEWFLSIPTTNHIKAIFQVQARLPSSRRMPRKGTKHGTRPLLIKARQDLSGESEGFFFAYVRVSAAPLLLKLAFLRLLRWLANDNEQVTGVRKRKQICRFLFYWLLLLLTYMTIRCTTDFSVHSRLFSASTALLLSLFTFGDRYAPLLLLAFHLGWKAWAFLL